MKWVVTTLNNMNKILAKQAEAQSATPPPTLRFETRPASAVVDDFIRDRFHSDECLFLDALHSHAVSIPAACTQLATGIVDRLLADEGKVRAGVDHERLSRWEDELSKQLQKCEDKLRKKNLQRQLPLLHKACFEHLVHDLPSVKALTASPQPLISISLLAMSLPEMNVVSHANSPHRQKPTWAGMFGEFSPKRLRLGIAMSSLPIPSPLFVTNNQPGWLVLHQPKSQRLRTASPPTSTFRT